MCVMWLFAVTQQKHGSKPLTLDIQHAPDNLVSNNSGFLDNPELSILLNFYILNYSVYTGLWRGDSVYPTLCQILASKVPKIVKPQDGIRKTLF